MNSLPNHVTVPHRPRNLRPSKRARIVLDTVEIAALLAAPAADIGHRRVVVGHLPGVHGDRLAPIAIVVSQNVPAERRWPLFFRALDAHRRSLVANDTRGSVVVRLASWRPCRSAS